MKSLPLRLWHHATLYHIRYNKSGGNTLTFCKCGWKDPLMRLSLKYRFRRIWCALKGGHNWEEPDVTEFGPVGFEVPEISNYSKMCGDCLKITTIDRSEYENNVEGQLRT
jgi:hypothetical protein